jgi:hypothetical protein
LHDAAAMRSPPWLPEVMADKARAAPSAGDRQGVSRGVVEIEALDWRLAPRLARPPAHYFSFLGGRYLGFATRDDSDNDALYQWWETLKTFLP